MCVCITFLFIHRWTFRLLYILSLKQVHRITSTQQSPKLTAQLGRQWLNGKLLMSRLKGNIGFWLSLTLYPYVFICRYFPFLKFSWENFPHLRPKCLAFTQLLFLYLNLVNFVLSLHKQSTMFTKEHVLAFSDKG